MKYVASFLIATCVILCCSRVLAGDSFDGFQSQHKELKGYYIVDAGNATKVDPPFGKQWAKDLFELNGRCFTMDSYQYLDLWDYGGKAGLLLVNKQQDVRLALIKEDITNLEVKLEPITLFECPAESGVVSPCTTEEECTERLEQLKEQIENQRKDREKLIRQLERK